MGSHPREFESEPSRLLEADHDKLMDSGAPGQAIRSDLAVAPLGALDRPRTSEGKARVAPDGSGNVKSLFLVLALVAGTLSHSAAKRRRLPVSF
jgi:hypothetical protein